MKKVLLFGATGQIGSNVAVYLKDKGYDVVAVCHRSSDGGFFATKGIRYIGGVANENSADFAKLPTDIDVVINLAGAMPAHANASPMPYIQSIVVGTVNICEWLRTKTSCKRIVFNTTPSDVIQYLNQPIPVPDYAPRSFPKNGGDHAVYAIAKNTAVDILEHYGIAYGFKPIVFRHDTIYSWSESPYYNINGERKKLPWRVIVENSIEGKTVEVWGNPNFKKCLLYIKDFCSAIECAVNSECTGIYNLSGVRFYTMEEQIQGIIDVFGDKSNPPSKKYCPEKPSTPMHLYADEKAKIELGWNPCWDWWKACEDMKKVMKEKPFHLLEMGTKLASASE
jgi:UDP-glucose 4-epimerase